VGGCVTVRHCVTALEVLSARVAGLTISRTDPEAFHLERSEVAAALRALARRVGRAA